MGTSNKKSLYFMRIGQPMQSKILAKYVHQSIHDVALMMVLAVDSRSSASDKEKTTSISWRLSKDCILPSSVIAWGESEPWLPPFLQNGSSEGYGYRDREGAWRISWITSLSGAETGMCDVAVAVQSVY